MVIPQDERSRMRIKQEDADDLNFFQALVYGNIQEDKNDDNEDDVWRNLADYTNIYKRL